MCEIINNSENVCQKKYKRNNDDYLKKNHKNWFFITRRKVENVGTGSYF